MTVPTTADIRKLSCPLFGISPGCGFLLPVTVDHFQGQSGAVSRATFLAALIRSVLGRTGLDPEVLSRFSSSQWAGLGLPHFGQLGVLLTQGFSRDPGAEYAL